ncbi:MAG: N-acetyltransferase family protein [Planctomycetota bacterium]
MPAALRPLEAADAALYAELRLLGLRESPAAFGSSWEEEHLRSPEEMAARLRRDDDSLVLGCFEDDALTGMAGFYRDKHLKQRHRGHVWGMYVRPEARGRGHARALVSGLIAHARGVAGLLQLNLEVVTEQTAALALYRSLGFERYGLERRALVVSGRALDEELLVLPLAPFSP